MATDFTALTTSLGITLSGTAQKSTDLSTTTDPLTITESLALTFGTGAGKADQRWHDRRLLAASASENLDLAGSLINAFGGTVTFANVKIIFVRNVSDETTTSPAHTATDAAIAVGAAASNVFQGPFQDTTDAVNIAAGGVFLVGRADTSGWTVTASSGDMLKVANLDGADEAMYDIVIIGESA